MVKPILIAGPTASGKSSLALAIAREFNGVVVNADSAQVYAELSIITARPTDHDLQQAPHRLYGHVSGDLSDPTAAYSTGAWLDDVTACLDEIAALGKRAVIVGGTGLYFQALLKGLSSVPEISADVRTHWRDEADRLGVEALYKVLQDIDPLMAEQLMPTDPQRIVRALEVIDSTGRSLKHWQQETGPSLLKLEETVPFVLSFEREALYERINLRFAQMVREGGLDEVIALRALGFDKSAPLMRAIGVPELCEYLDGSISLEEAILAASQQSRRYAKRQLTWLRRNMISWNMVNAQDMEREMVEIFAIIRDRG